MRSSRRHGGSTRLRRQNEPIDFVALSLQMEQTPDGGTHGGRRLSGATSLELDAVRFQPFSQSLCFPSLQPFHSLCSSPLHVLPSDDSHVLSVKYDSSHQSRRRPFVAHQLCYPAFRPFLATCPTGSTSAAFTRRSLLQRVQMPQFDSSLITCLNH